MEWKTETQESSCVYRFCDNPSIINEETSKTKYHLTVEDDPDIKITSEGSIILPENKPYAQKGTIIVSGSISEYKTIYKNQNCVMKWKYKTLLLPFGDIDYVKDNKCIVRTGNDPDRQNGEWVEMHSRPFEDVLVKTSVVKQSETKFIRSESFKDTNIYDMHFLHSLSISTPNKVITDPIAVLYINSYKVLEMVPNKELKILLKVIRFQSDNIYCLVFMIHTRKFQEPLI